VAAPHYLGSFFAPPPRRRPRPLARRRHPALLPLARLAFDVVVEVSHTLTLSQAARPSGGPIATGRYRR
jgi:hypothetical protein